MYLLRHSCGRAIAWHGIRPIMYNLLLYYTTLLHHCSYMHYTTHVYTRSHVLKWICVCTIHYLTTSPDYTSVHILLHHPCVHATSRDEIYPDMHNPPLYYITLLRHCAYVYFIIHAIVCNAISPCIHSPALYCTTFLQNCVLLYCTIYVYT